MEKPNLEYVDKLANGDESVRKMLVDVIKTEFPEEKKDYYNSLKNYNYKKIEENVHRLKHKISILGLEKSYKIANKFEHNLRELNLDKAEDFEKILIVISAYLKTI
ncbi:Hpt domain-containing protein [Tenacibaculum sp. AHE15PA]|uniref:Hpt domain-containing protein n=1 Tax=unclassified Tenacibaculum TaxID=2635139 RepID=UPI001C4E5CA4|nr:MULTISPECIES: Hpt domain-containing protein [unclassified Tenacibaculum]QXP73678.1 Hpt domain-containing protein [Tenacibaculum sp. AHE14PA]QXP75955.1 Hpt domain-containing protein [Tenacibaculum sp. AHE15PA]